MLAVLSCLGRGVYIFIFLLGLSLGSFLNSWVWRRRENIRISRGRSICPHCRRQLLWYENIPVLSFIFLKGKCGTCHTNIPTHYALIELGVGLIFVLLAHHHVNSAQYNSALFVRDIFFIMILVVLFLYDMMYQVIITELTWLGALCAFLINYFVFHYSLSSMFWGVVVAAGFFLLQYIVSKGRWIGGGDIQLGVMIGILLGFPASLVALFLAYVIGAAISVPLVLLKKKGLNTATPFGTYLAIGTFIALLWGEQIVGWYMRVIGM